MDPLLSSLLPIAAVTAAGQGAPPATVAPPANFFARVSDVLARPAPPQQLALPLALPVDPFEPVELAAENPALQVLAPVDLRNLGSDIALAAADTGRTLTLALADGAPMTFDLSAAGAAPVDASSIFPAIMLQATGGESAATAAVPEQGRIDVQPDKANNPDANSTPVTAEDALIDGRRRPGVQKGLPDRVVQNNPGAVRPPPPESFYVPDVQLAIAVPDRWRLTSALCPGGSVGGNVLDFYRGRELPADLPDQGVYAVFPSLQNVCHSSLDPYHHNVLKGDRPLSREQRPGFLHGEDWFFILSGISDTIVEPRSFPIPVGNQTTTDPDRNDVFGRSHSLVLAQTFIVGASLLKGQTAYKPPAVEYRIALAGQVNYVDVPERRVLLVDPAKPSHRSDHFVGVQELFVDYHLARFDNDRYDFVSVRAGIQPFNADFRGFLFQDNQLGIRLFGNRDNNRFQFNLAAFWRLEKDTNSGLNSVVETPRRDWVFHANLFRQDFPVVGLTSQVSVTYNRNREAFQVQVDDNGFPVRPSLLGDLRTREYDVYYVGYGFDGRFGRINLTGQVYGAFGEDRNSFFTSEPADIRAYFGAIEASYDTDWARFRLSGLYASGDSDPYNNTEGGFDAIFENPIFAGADTSYWIRQTIPFAGGGRAVGLNGRNGILNSLRSSKEQGQSNFNNPGTILVGAGADFDLTPQFRISANVNHLWFENTSTLQVLRNEGTIPTDIGFDYSLAAIYRPSAVQNVVFRLSGAVLDPGDGFSDLFSSLNSGDDDRFYSVLFNAILTF